MTDAFELLFHVYFLSKYLGEASVQICVVDWADGFLMIEVWDSSHILNTRPLSDTCFANVFFQSVTCFRIFWKAEVFSFDGVQFTDFYFMDSTLGMISRKSLSHLTSPNFSPMSSSRSCIVLGFPFRSIFSFELKVVTCIWTYICSTTIYRKNYPLSTLYNTFFHVTPL